MHQAAVDDLSEGGGVGLHDGLRIGHLHLLGENAELQRKIDAGGLVHVQIDSAMNGSAKALLLDRHPVAPGRQQRGREIAVVVGQGLAGGVGAIMEHGHPGLRDYSPTDVSYCTGDGPCRIVRQERKDQRASEQGHQ